MLIPLFYSLFSVWQDKEYRHARHDDHNAEELLWRDRLMEQEVGKDTGANGLAEDAHGDKGGGHIFQQHIEHKVSADGADKGEAEEGKPRGGRITHERITADKAIGGEDNGADKIAEDGVGDGGGALSHGRAHEKVHRDDTRRQKGEDIAPQA